MRIDEDAGLERTVEIPVPVETSVKSDHKISIDGKMREALDMSGDAMAFSVPKYETSRKGNLSVSHAIIDGEDYYYQIELMKKAKIENRTIIGVLVQAFSTVVPDHVDVFIKEPAPELDWPVWTVIVKGGAKLMGAKEFMEKKLVGKLLELNFW
jgi:hypothetical protein